MKKIFFTKTMVLLSFLLGAGNFAFAQSREVNIEHIDANYVSNPPTVTFRVYWDREPDHNRHRDTVWVFVDYRLVRANGSLGPWTPATIESPVDANNGTVLTPVALPYRGFYLDGHGFTPTFSSTVTVKLDIALQDGEKFNYCAYVTDYPPNATIGAGHYDLHGSPPFVVNGDTLAAGVREYTGCITELTDATGCPGFLPTLPTADNFTANTTTICNGESITLTATATGAASYSYDGGLSWTASSVVTLSPTATDDYSLYVINAAGCTASYSPPIIVTVNPLPEISDFSAASPTLCAGESTTLTVTATGADAYSYDGGSSWVADSYTPTDVLTTTTTYTVYARSSEGCTATFPTAVTVTVNPKPIAAFENPPTVACAGSTITLTASGGGSYCFTEICTGCIRNPYLSGNDEAGGVECDVVTVPCSYTLDNTYDLIMPESGSVRVWVKVENGYGCVDSTYIDVAAVSAPTIALTSAATTTNQIVNRGDAITPIIYTATGASSVTVTGLPNDVTGTWSGDTFTISGTPDLNGSYAYTVQTTNDHGCDNASAGGTITVTGPIAYAGCTSPTLSLSGIGFESSATYEIHGLIISAPVTVTTCDKPDFDGGSSGAFNADCRNNPANSSYGHLFSWCMVKQYADQLCPSPWRAPTTGDFCKIANGSESICTNATYQYPGSGWLFGGVYADGTMANEGSTGYYWASTESEYNAAIYGSVALVFISGSDNIFAPQSSAMKHCGLPLRCVRNAE